MKFPKTGRIKLTGTAYSELVEQVYSRDGWRCRRCNSPLNLHPHHILKRSKVRLDTPENLVTLCAACHELVERHKVIIIGEDANGVLQFRVP